MKMHKGCRIPIGINFTASRQHSSLYIGTSKEAKGDAPFYQEPHTNALGSCKLVRGLVWADNREGLYSAGDHKRYKKRFDMNICYQRSTFILTYRDI